MSALCYRDLQALGALASLRWHAYWRECTFCKVCCLPWYLLQCVEALAYLLGLLAWHLVERCRQSATVLTESRAERQVVYGALGHAVLSAVALQYETTALAAYAILAPCLY